MSVYGWMAGRLHARTREHVHRVLTFMLSGPARPPIPLSRDIQVRHAVCVSQLTSPCSYSDEINLCAVRQLTGHSNKRTPLRWRVDAPGGFAEAEAEELGSAPFVASRAF